MGCDMDTLNIPIMTVGTDQEEIDIHVWPRKRQRESAQRCKAGLLGIVLVLLFLFQAAKRVGVSAFVED